MQTARAESKAKGNQGSRLSIQSYIAYEEVHCSRIQAQRTLWGIYDKVETLRKRARRINLALWFEDEGVHKCVNNEAKPTNLEYVTPI